MMNMFDYVTFNEQYNILKNVIGEDNGGIESISGVITNCNRVIKEGLEYAEDSVWASSTINEWNELMGTLNQDLANLKMMLQQARQVAEQYKQFEQGHTSIQE